MLTPILSLFAKPTVTVSLHADGSCLLCHGAMEMGQGVNTKLSQICAQTLDIPLEKIYNPPTTSVMAPNATSTGGSMTVDIFGPAIIDACNQLKERLAPFKTEGKSQLEAIMTAAMSGAVLNVMGKHVFKPWFDSLMSHDFLYFSWNGACVVAEVDLLTGQSTFISSDLLQDFGRSLNPAIDVGQVEGAFVQGLSWLTIEDLEALYDAEGKLHLDLESLEIACPKNMPLEFNVSLFQSKNSANPDAPYGSKGTGEPPQSLGIAGALAVRQALSAARQSNGQSAWVKNMNYPLTPARFVQASGLNLDAKKSL